VGAWVAASIALTGPVQARRDAEVVVEPIHSSLPLYNFAWEDLWPRGFANGDTFGCTSRIGFGDWRFTPAKTNLQQEEAWYRFSNYGVFHCAAVLARANARAKLGAAHWDYGFFVRLGKARYQSTQWELWALQGGILPGSNYTLLAREQKKAGLIVKFRVLQQRCPSDMIRESRGLDVWSTRYCAIDSRAELLSLARRMLDLPGAGEIARVYGAE
jgi:hypothetical protein